MELLLNTEESTIQDKLLDLIERNKSIKILSPYVTKSKASDCILGKSDFKLTLVLDFDPEKLVKGSTHLDVHLIKQLIKTGQEVFYNTELHSKLYITDESVILGSSNFTRNGLCKRKESAILFKRDFHEKIYLECKEYYESILESSVKVTEDLINKTIKIIDDKEISRTDMIEKLGKILSKDYEKRSLNDDYDFKYEYPKTLNELQKGLRFDFINYEEVENQYKEMFPTMERRIDERIAFIKTNLYEKNKGYNIKTNVNRSASAVCRWYHLNENKFDFPLKSYKDFIVERSIELLKQYKESFDIQPATGFFAKKFEYLKERGLIDDNFFSVKFAEFEEAQQFNMLKDRLTEIDEFYTEHGRPPDRNARYHIRRMERNGTLNKDIERKLRYEGSLRDRMFMIKKKYNEGFYKQEYLKKIIEQYYTKWGWTV